ncbi:hypothetical protein QBC42DRAFT_288331 [Cladorrhinum samala]|uniref:Uncharacterized protein n=1 Tax=Cladorrhinum samala TaxID=585594 RepID=A0AAV9HIU5_9PEZI|nr:hypothetical protein QBC42DRAFT_288331 [Cladorrhinum samala]
MSEAEIPVTLLANGYATQWGMNMKEAGQTKEDNARSGPRTWENSELHVMGIKDDMKRNLEKTSDDVSKLEEVASLDPMVSDVTGEPYNSADQAVEKFQSSIGAQNKFDMEQTSADLKRLLRESRQQLEVLQNETQKPQELKTWYTDLLDSQLDKTDTKIVTTIRSAAWKVQVSLGSIANPETLEIYFSYRDDDSHEDMLLLAVQALIERKVQQAKAQRTENQSALVATSLFTNASRRKPRWKYSWTRS